VAATKNRAALYFDDHHLVPTSVCAMCGIEDPNFPGNVKQIEIIKHHRGLHRIGGNLVPWRYPLILLSGYSYYWRPRRAELSYNKLFGQRSLPEAILVMERELIPILTDDKIVDRLVQHNFVTREEERYLELIASRKSRTRTPLWERVFSSSYKPFWLQPLSEQKMAMIRAA
jgi:hypothetical protein